MHIVYPTSVPLSLCPKDPRTPFTHLRVHSKCKVGNLITWEVMAALDLGNSSTVYLLPNDGKFLSFLSVN